MSPLYPQRRRNGRDNHYVVGRPIPMLIKYARSGGSPFAHDSTANRRNWHIRRLAHAQFKGRSGQGTGQMMVETLGIHELWLFILSGLLLNVTPGPDTAYIIGRSVQFGWRGGAAAATGISCRLPRSRVRRRHRPVGAVDGVIGGLHGAEMGRRRLSVVYRRPDAAVAFAPAGGGGRGRQRDVAFPRVLAGRADQCAQSEGGAVLSGLPAAIRGGGIRRTRRWPSWCSA